MRYRYVIIPLLVIALSVFGFFIYNARDFLDLDTYRPKLQRLLTQKLHKPVNIKHIDLVWGSQGPAIFISEITVAKKNQPQRLQLRFKDVHFYPDLVTNFAWFKRPTGRITIKRLHLPTLKLTINDLTGSMKLTDDQLVFNKLSGRWRQLPQHAEVNLKLPKGKSPRLTIDFNGDVSAAAIADYLHINRHMFAKHLQGKTIYTGHILFSQGDKQDEKLTLTSQLSGVKVDLPGELAKPAEQKRLLVINLDMLPADKIPVTFKYGQLAKGSLLLYRQPIRLDHAFFQFERLQPYGEDFNGLKANLSRGKSAWMIKLQHPNLMGRLFIPYGGDSGALITGRLQRLVLTFKNGQPRHYYPRLRTHKALKHLEDRLLPTQLPNINISCKQLIYGKFTLSNIDLHLRKIKAGVRVPRFNLRLQETFIKTQGGWTVRDNRQWSWLSGQVKTNNLGATLTHWGTGHHLSKGVGVMNFSLRWPGVFYRPYWQRMHGDLNFKAHDGLIVRVPKKAAESLDLLRLLNFLNPSMLFSHFGLGSHGATKSHSTAYDLFQGAFTFKGGSAYTHNLYLLSNLFNLKATGRIGIVNKDFDLNVWIHPLVTADLPVVATLLGGPIAGAVGWLVDKVFVEPVMGEAVAKRFHVVGPWRQPVVKPR